MSLVSRRSDSSLTAPLPKSEKVKSWEIGIFAIVLYSTCSIGIVLFNKILYNGAFPYPLYISAVQQLLAVLLGLMGKLAFDQVHINNPIFPAAPVTLKDIFKTSKTAISFVAYISFANLSLKYTSVSNYLITRSFTLPGTYIMTKYYLKEYITRNQLYGVLIVFFGFGLGNVQVEAISFDGMYLGILSSIFQILYGVSSKQCQSTMQYKENMMLFVSLWSFILFIPITFIMENPVDSSVELVAAGNSIKLLVLLSCFAGIFISYSVFMIIFHFSPLAYEIAGFFKGALQSLLGIVILGDVFDIWSCVSIVSILCGSFLYSYAGFESDKKYQSDLPGRFHLEIPSTPPSVSSPTSPDRHSSTMHVMESG